MSTPIDSPTPNTLLNCEKCQRPLSDGEQCMFCMLQLGKSQNSGSKPAIGDLPSEQELASQFPQLEISRLVGRGGMGAIYHARQKSLERDVALKLISRDLGKDPAFAERFAREARTLAKLSHPNIVNVYDFGTSESGTIYLMMEFVDGMNLREALDTNSLDPRDTLKIISEICSALQYAHDKGIVHRDIKPENVLINEEGIIKVADFGLAKILDDSPQNLTLTNTRQVMGTLHYMAPEQFESPEEIDQRVDLYSLGVMFYELLTGTLPIGRFELPSIANKELPKSLDPLLLKLLKRKPDERYQSASEFQSDLQRLDVDDANLSAPVILQPEPIEGALTVAFEVDKDGLSQSEGVIQLEGDTLLFSFRTKFAGLIPIKNSTSEPTRVPLGAIAKIEWRPRYFGSKILISLRHIQYLNDLPPCDSGQLRLNIKTNDTRAAAMLVIRANRRETQSVVDPENELLTQQVADGSFHVRPSMARIVAAVLFFIGAVWGLAGIVVLGTLVESISQAIFPIIIIATVGCITMQILGGILVLSPFSRRMPIVSAGIASLPIHPGFPVGIGAAIATYFALKTDPIARNENRAPVLLPRAGQNQFQSTMMFLRESKSARIASFTSGAIALLGIGILALSLSGFFGTETRFRVISSEHNAADLKLLIEERCVALAPESVWVEVGSEGKPTLVGLSGGWMQKEEIKNALKLPNTVSIAWTVLSDDENAQELPLAGPMLPKSIWTSPQPFSMTVSEKTQSFGQMTSSDSTGIETVDFLTEIDLSQFPVAAVEYGGGSLSLRWSQALRQRLLDARPENAIGLVVLYDGLVEAHAKTKTISRFTSFSVAIHSDFNQASLEAAIQGPSLDCELQFLD